MSSNMPSSKFVFNPSAQDNEFVVELRKEAERLRALLADLEERVTIDRAQIFKQLIMFFPPDTSVKEIKVLGKALVKYAEEIKPRLAVLNKELNVIDEAKANPDLLALAFADSETFQRDLDLFKFDEA